MMGDENWGPDPVVVTGDVMVPSGITLTIQPGTVIRFAALSDDTNSGTNSSRCELIIAGSLIADGTNGDIASPSNAASPANGDWVGIRVLRDSPFWFHDSLDMNHVVVEYASSGVSCTVSTGMPALEIANATLQNSGGIAITVSGGSTSQPTVSLTNCSLQNRDIDITT